MLTLLALPLLFSSSALALQSGSRGVPAFNSGASLGVNYYAPGARTQCSRPVRPVTTCNRQPVTTTYRTVVPATTSQPVAAARSFGNTGTSSATLIDPIFQTSNPNSPYRVNHASWDQFLSRNVANDAQGVSRVSYSQVSGQDRQLLGSYLQQLQNTDIRALNRNEQFAFWTNLYNARTVALVLDNYPVSSIQQINNGKAFDTPGAVTVLGKSLSLNQIESGIIRPVWNDPRIHYALNCAAYGCPNLATSAYTGQNANSRLNEAAYAFINTDRAVQRTANGLQVSKIYDWYKDDFGGTDQGVISHISQYANPATLSKINGQTTIQDYYYDWSLNDAAGYDGQVISSPGQIIGSFAR